MPTSTKCQKIEIKMTIKVKQHDDRLWYLRLFYDGAFSIVSKNDLDDQNLLLATVHTSFFLFPST
jgi:preprotein translocase subunit SecB